MPRPVLHRLFALLLSALGLAPATGLADPEPPPLLPIASAARPPENPWTKEPAVRVRGVITWRKSGESSDLFCLQDHSAAIWLDLQTARERKIWDANSPPLPVLEEGSEVEVVGSLLTNSLPWTLLPAKLTLLARKPLPPSLQNQDAHVLAGGSMLQRVSLAGVVHRCTPILGGYEISLHTAAGRYFLARIPDGEQIHRAFLEDALVEVTGIASPLFNSRGKFVRPCILVSSPAGLNRRKPAGEPFAAPLLAIADFYGAVSKGDLLHRHRVKGTVTLCEPGKMLFLQDEDTAIRVWTDSTDLFRLGDQVEASGFPEISGGLGELRSALVRKIGEGHPPSPWELPPQRPETASAPQRNLRDFEGVLSRVRGKLIRVNGDPKRGTLQIVLDNGETLTTATLSHCTAQSVRDLQASLQPGSLLSATGVTLLPNDQPEENTPPGAPQLLDLHLRSPADLQILEQASAWTPTRLGIALGSTALLLVASLLWTFFLRRMVSQRSKRLAAMLSQHRIATLEFRAAQRERQRLAADMHDGIQQLILGASFRLQAAEASLPESALEAQTQLGAARGTLLRAQTSLRNFLAGTASEEHAPEDLCTLVQHTIRSADHWPRDAVSVHLLGETFPLSRPIMGSLVLLIQEAVSNAFKHGHARSVKVRLIFKDTTLEIRVEDDGIGFHLSSAPGTDQGHHGLESMRRRMRWLGGNVDIQSEPHKGTCVRIRLPKNRSKTTRRLRIS